MKPTASDKLKVLAIVVTAAAALAACDGLPPSAMALIDRQAIDAFGGTGIQISPTSELSIGGEIEFTGIAESISDVVWSVGGVTVQIAPGTEINGAPTVGEAVKVHGLLQSDASVLAFEVEASGSPTDTPEAGETEFTGKVESILGDLWTIGGQAVTVDGATEVKGTPAVGDDVKVHGRVQPDGSILAREIEKLGVEDSHDGDAAQSEFIGVVESIVGDVWTIGGQAVTVDGATEIKGGPALGDSVKVHAVAQPDGSLLALEIELANADENGQDDNSQGDDNQGDDDQDQNPGAGQEITGVLQSMNGDLWLVDGLQVRVSASTEIKGDPQLGDTVKVEGTLLEDGSIEARELSVEEGGVLHSGDDDLQEPSGHEGEGGGSSGGHGSGSGD